MQLITVFCRLHHLRPHKKNGMIPLIWRQMKKNNLIWTQMMTLLKRMLPDASMQRFRRMDESMQKFRLTDGSTQKFRLMDEMMRYYDYNYH